MKCPICSSTEYEEIKEYIPSDFGGFGVYASKGYYTCLGCSVVFIDPKKFYQPVSQINEDIPKCKW